MGDSPGFEHNQPVNNRGYRPSAHVRVGAELDELRGEFMQMLARG